MKTSLKEIFVGLALALATSIALAQEGQSKEATEASYTKVITDRADKIVVKLGIDDKKKEIKVRDIIVGQYRSLNAIHENRNSKTKLLKEQTEDKGIRDTAIKQLENTANADLATLHKKYIRALKKQLNGEQVEQVKDAMTYGVLPLTYRAYQEMLPNLTQEQKKQILAWLTDARELAMDAESSDKKHAWFGKYKGRINNYLSAAGVDVKQAGIDWQKRIKEKESKKVQ